eukprot:9579607-Lingulodinium_polyedra.AAC.1
MAAPGGAEDLAQVTLPGRPAEDGDVPPQHGPPRLYRVLADAWNSLWCVLRGKIADGQHVRTGKRINKVEWEREDDAKRKIVWTAIQRPSGRGTD